MGKKFDSYDYFILSLVLLVSIFIGLYQTLKVKFGFFLRKYRIGVKSDLKNAQSEIKNYLIAGGTMSAIPIAFSLLATNFSGNVLLGFPAEIYEYGTQFSLMILGISVTPIIGAFLTGPLFLRLNVMSVFEYFKLRYNSNLIRLIGVFCYFIRIVLSTAMYIYGPATTINYLTSVDGTWSIILIGSVATFYTTIGGIRAVIWTDVFQIVIMFTGILIVIFYGTYSIGGFQVLWQISELGGRINFFEFDTNLFIRQSTWALIIGNFSQFCMQYCIDQQMVQRFLAAKSKRTAQIALLMNIPGIIILLGICCFTGLVIFANYSQCDPLSNRQIKHPNQIVPYFVSEKLHAISGTSGLFLAAVLAAALSSVSSTLNSLASILWEDLLKRWSFFETLNDSKSTITTKILVILCGTLCTSLALLFVNAPSNIIQISGMINGAFTAPIIGLFILSSIFSFANIYGACIGTIAGLCVSIWLSFGTYLAKPKYPKLGVSRECCNSNATIACNGSYFIENSTLLFTQNKYLKEASNLIGFQKVYSISYHWYSLIPIIVTVFFGILISLATKGYKKRVARKYMLFNVQNNCKNMVEIEENIEFSTKL